MRNFKWISVGLIYGTHSRTSSESLITKHCFAYRHITHVVYVLLVLSCSTKLLEVVCSLHLLRRILHWRWMQHVTHLPSSQRHHTHPKHWYHSIGPHGVTTHTKVILMVTVMRSSYLRLPLALKEWKLRGNIPKFAGLTEENYVKYQSGSLGSPETRYLVFTIFVIWTTFTG